MKSKTRYNIRLSERKGVKIKMSTNVSDIDTFYDLMLKTSRRDNFYPHPKKHYQDLIKILGPKNIAKIFLAEYKKKVISATIVSFFGQKAIYLHGASDNEYRNLMSTYLLQWRAILEAKKAGCKLYDFGGVVPESENKHAWGGISRFKRGFGGREQEFIGAWDVPYSASQYKLFSFSSNIRRKIKRA
jgi:peptidoglycan pentaglycine glycine transferase (the first glycine)